MPSSMFSLDAIVRKSKTSTFLMAAEIAARSFTMDAWFMEARATHDRTLDHYGIESDLVVALSGDIGPYVAYTPIHYVLEDMVARIDALESNERVRETFTMDAFISSQSIFLDAIIRGTVSGVFTIDAYTCGGGSFSIDAYIQGGFTIDAFLV